MVRRQQANTKAALLMSIFQQEQLDSSSFAGSRRKRTLLFHKIGYKMVEVQSD